MGNFKRDLKTGERGEEIVVKYLESLDDVEFIQDVRDVKGYQIHDIDFVVYTKKSKVIPIEVKSDTMAHRTGNIAYEVFSHKRLGTKGCLEKTKAKTVYYYLICTGELYSIDVKKLRDHVHINYKDKRLIAMGDNAEGYLIKIKELLEKQIAEKISI